jgi:hypothetical protein
MARHRVAILRPKEDAGTVCTRGAVAVATQDP